VGRERFPRLSQHIQDGVLISHRSNVGPEAHPLKCGLKDRVDYNAAKLLEYLRCLLVIQSLCNFTHCALSSSMLSLVGFNVVVGRKRWEKELGLVYH
jgi:hypothetical protein